MAVATEQPPVRITTVSRDSKKLCLQNRLNRVTFAGTDQMNKNS